MKRLVIKIYSTFIILNLIYGIILNYDGHEINNSSINFLSFVNAIIWAVGYLFLFLLNIESVRKRYSEIILVFILPNAFIFITGYILFGIYWLNLYEILVLPNLLLSIITSFYFYKKAKAMEQSKKSG